MWSLSNLQRRLTHSLPDNQIRTQIARDLHDGVVQDLVALGYGLDAVIARSDITTSARTEIRRMRLSTMDIINKVRLDILQLRNDDISIDALLKLLFHSSDIELVLRGELPYFQKSDNTLRRELTLIIREIALNALRYSDATRFTLATEFFNDYTVITIDDDGIGRATVSEGHFGLQNIKERIASLDGTLTMTSGANGTTFVIVIPRRLSQKRHDENSFSR